MRIKPEHLILTLQISWEPLFLRADSAPSAQNYFSPQRTALLITLKEEFPNTSKPVNSKNKNLFFTSFLLQSVSTGFHFELSEHVN